MGDEDSKAEAEEGQEAPAPSQGARQTEATLRGAGPLEQQGSQTPRLPHPGEGVPGAQQTLPLTERLLAARRGAVPGRRLSPAAL